MKNLFPIILTLLLGGCISSTEPFYDDSSRVKDDRLVGSYTDEESSMSVLIEENDKNEENYTVKLVIPEGQITLIGTLFELGEERYMDLILESSGLPENSSSTVPGASDILKRIFMPKRHVIFGVEIKEGALEFRGNDSLSLLKFKDSYIYQLESVELLKRIQIEEDSIHVEGDPYLLLPSVESAYRNGDIFQKVGTLTK
jgi:hypothetical protein